jgi:hypothetical protein
MEAKVSQELDVEYSRVETRLNDKISYLAMLQERTRDIENIADDLTFVSKSVGVMDLNF